MPAPPRRRRRRRTQMREIINAIRYLVGSGCGWRMLPVNWGRLQGTSHHITSSVSSAQRGFESAEA
jgi:transposase